MLRSMLVALDGSACSFTATTLALDWARRFDARILALGIVDAVSTPPAGARTARCGGVQEGAR